MSPCGVFLSVAAFLALGSVGAAATQERRRRRRRSRGGRRSEEAVPAPEAQPGAQWGRGTETAPPLPPLPGGFVPPGVGSAMVAGKVAAAVEVGAPGGAVPKYRLPAAL